MNLPIPESYWVEENRFLAGAYPGDYGMENARRRLDSFLALGIASYIDLTQSHELASYETLLKQQAQDHELTADYHRFAIRDHGIPSREMMVDILDTIDKALNHGRKVYVHCWGGVGRTGTTVGCFLVRHGMNNIEALATVNKLYKTRPNNNFYPNSPETEEQIKFVLNWHETPVHKSDSNKNQT
jgi:protein-tyrosine phosphatase